MPPVSSRRWVAGLLVCASLAGCATPQAQIRPPTAEPVTTTGAMLRALPPPRRRVDVAVYSYEDRTGQQKPNDFVAEFSKAVTQGADAILVDVLKSAAGARWFTVVERGGLTNLMTERNLIEQSHRAYRGAQTSPLPALRFAGVLLEGGIVNYDSNIETGGAGARLLGIGASTQYRRDSVTVFLRAVSVNTGEVMESVTAAKTIYSVLTQGTVFRYIDADEVLEAEAGIARNEPTGLAVRQAIELAVYRLILEGAESGIWAFADAGAQRALLAQYRGQNAQRPRRSAPAAPPAAPPAAAPAAIRGAAPTATPVATLGAPAASDTDATPVSARVRGAAIPLAGAAVIPAADKPHGPAKAVDPTVRG
jgi:curli production assembly/transport component CsgG